jgi:5'-nucleotidase
MKKIEISSAVFLAICIALTGLASSYPDPSENETLEVQILAINDLHGHLEPPQGTVRVGYNSDCQPVQVEAGGAEYLATHIKGLKATNPETILVSAGDNGGASPLISALFHDEPTIEALSMMGFDYSAVGNHEFDEGAGELLRMQYGCCHPATGCQDGERFVGAGFRYLAANVVNETTNETLFPPYDVRSIQGVPVAFIGVALKSTPAVVVPSGVEGLKFIDEAEAINSCVEILKEEGVETIVVLVHNGGLSEGLPNEGMKPCEPVEDIVNRTDDEVDLFITGHSHQAYISKIDGRTVTQAGWEGNFITDIDLVISPMTRDVVEVRAKNVAVTRDVPKDPAISALLDKYAKLVGPLANEVIGSVTADISRKATESGESALGDLIADAQLCATSCNESAVVAFMNPGGIRTNILFNKTTGEEQPGKVTYQEAFNVQPFDNSLIVMNLTGSQIDAILEEQFDNPCRGQNRMLQVSGGFTYAWCESAPTGSKVEISSIKIDGKPINPDGTYRVAANCFLAEGGDGFITFSEGVDRICGISDLEALVNYLKAFSPVSPPPMDRISVVKEASCGLSAPMATA